MTDQPSRAARSGAAARRTRRQMITGGTGAIAALAAGALARPVPAQAASGKPVVLGETNTETAETIVSNSSGSDALSGSATGTGRGLTGISDTGAGVYGQSGTTASEILLNGFGVHGITDHATGFGVLGENYGDGTAVAGLGGLYGTGVHGTSNSGVGVYGEGGAIGVRGLNTGPGPGVQGDAFTGIGVLATGMIGLSVQGPAMFSRSGVLTVRAGHSSATHTVINMGRASMVLATLQQDLDGIWVRSAVPDPVGSTFTIHLNKAAPKHVEVAWFMING